MFDLIIIGGGPAGTAAALTAANQGVAPGRILLLEQGCFPRHKVCGEFVSSEALGLLDTLLANAEAALLPRAVRIGRARLYIGRRRVEFSLHAPAASIPRYALDAALWRAAEARGIHCRPQTSVEQVLRGGDAFQVHTSAAALGARSVIDAAGRWSKLRAATPQNDNGSPVWLGLKAHFRAETLPGGCDQASTDLYFFDGGYCGVQPVSAELLNVCAMVRADCAVRLPQVFAEHAELYRRSRDWSQATETVATAPLRFTTPQPARGDVLCAGDTAGFIDPFVGDGISLALRSGTLAGAGLARFCRGETTLAAALRQYTGDYRRFLPVFRNAARARILLEANFGRRLALWLMRVPAVARLVLKATR